MIGKRGGGLEKGIVQTRKQARILDGGAGCIFGDNVRIVGQLRADVEELASIGHLIAGGEAPVGMHLQVEPRRLPELIHDTNQLQRKHILAQIVPALKQNTLVKNKTKITARLRIKSHVSGAAIKQIQLDL